MLYDNGPLPSGDKPRTPMYRPPAYTPTPRLPLPQQAYAPGDHNRRLYKQSMGMIPGMRRGAITPTGAPPMMPPLRPMRPQYRSVTGGMAGAPAGMRGYRPRNPNQMRDAAGNMPGDWDYQQPMPQQQRPPMVGFGGYSQPQYYGNPFLPMVSY